MRLRIAAFVAIVAVSLSAFGQPLAGKIPADALIYVGWQGSQNLGAAYDQSNLKGFLDASNLQQQIAEFIPHIATALAKKDRNAADAMRLFTAIGAPVWRHPSAFYFGGVDFSNPNMPKARLALLVDAGDEAPALTQRLQQIVQRGGKKADEIKVAVYGTLVAVTVGQSPSFESLLSGENAAEAAPALSTNKEFLATMAQVRKEPVAAAYFDGQGLIKLIDESVAKGHDRDAKKNWPAVRDQIGLQGLGHFAWAAGFDGKDWASDAFVQIANPNVGFVGGMTARKPISAEAYAAIPSGATMAGIFRFDVAGLYRAIHSIVNASDKKGGEEFDQGVAQANQMLGMDIEKDLLQSMGDEWVYYVDPAIAGSGLLGFTLINRAADATKLEQSLTHMEQVASAMMGGAAGRDVHLGFRQLKQGDLTVHYLGVPLVTPCWAVKDGNLYISLYPQILVGAAHHVSTKGASILSNEKFTALRDRMNGKAAVDMSFQDLPRTAPDAYQMLLVLSRLYIGAADMFGMEAPAMLPPPLYTITPYLSPAGSISWVDDAGWHRKSLSPFPGSQALAQSGIGASAMGQNALLVSILLPSLNRGRETANRVKCASNMRMIGQYMLLYSNENKNKLPPDMGELIKTQEIPPIVFICPSGDGSVPPEIATAPKDRQAKWVNEHSDYVYLGKGKTNTAPPDTIVLYEKPGSHGGDGMNLLFGDGHVEFMNMKAAQKLIHDQTGKAVKDSDL